MNMKEEVYQNVIEQIVAILDNETNLYAKMATVACLLKHNFPQYYWCGFYIVDANKPQELVVGPYQGTLGCLRIPFGKGVCGEVAVTRQTKLVADVHAIENHIACDPKSSSEIVVPVVNANGELLAVLDVDSAETNSFDEIDQRYLEHLVAKVFAE